MKKPRIIIAECDQAYLKPLLHKFIKKFYERAALEIISDRDYFNELFIQQQTAELLIVSERLYEDRLQRHDIRHIFLLTDDKDSIYSDGKGVNVIYKYSNIQDIFTEIFEKCAKDLDIGIDNKQEARLVIFSSAAGGIGKTTAALNTALCLARQNKRVLYINSSYLQSFGYLFDNCAAVSDNELYLYMTDINGNIYQKVKNEIQKGKFDYLPPLKAALLSLGLSADIFLSIARGARESKDYDYIFMDTDSIFDEAGAEGLNEADKVVIITAETERAALETNRLAENINGINSDKYLFICFRDENDRNKKEYTALKTKFEIDEYIAYQNKADVTGFVDLSTDNGIKRLAYLIGV